MVAFRIMLAKLNQYSDYTVFTEARLRQAPDLILLPASRNSPLSWRRGFTNHYGFSGLCELRSAHWDQHTAGQAPWKLTHLTWRSGHECSQEPAGRRPQPTMFVSPGVPEKNFFLAPTLGIRSVLCLGTNSLR